MSPVRAFMLALFASLLMLFPAAGVHADAPAPYIGDQREGISGVMVTGQGSSHQINTYLFPVYTTSGTTPDLYAYCIELMVQSRENTPARYGSWDDFPGDNNFATDPQVRERVNWIINNSYPIMTLADFQAATGVPELTEKEAIAATQAAIWHFTDDFNLRGSGGNAERVRAAYNYLIGDDNVGLPQTTEVPWIELTASTDIHDAATPAGPVKVSTNQASVKVSVNSEHAVVDASGNTVNLANVKDGQELYVQVPSEAPAGAATFSSKVHGTSLSGKLLIIAEPNGEHAQTIITVEKNVVSDSAEATVRWKAATPPPTPTPTP
ncbi:MAG: thioester domain-containing protein, partial [Bowdeniella nasicola]|nr:thioester domain-containing protein [Bowdeniella nasicola]